MTNRRQAKPRTFSPQNTLNIGTLAPTRVIPAHDPPNVERTIKIQKRVQINQSSPLPVGGLNITPALIARWIPGGNTFWNSIRIDRIDVWGGSADGSITVSLPVDSAGGRPAFSMRDSGTAGSRRACVGIRFGLLERIRFWGTAETTVLAIIQSTAATELTIQASVELLSPTPGDPAS